MERRDSTSTDTWELTEEERAELDRREKLAELTTAAATALMEEIVRRMSSDAEKMEAFELRGMAEAVKLIASVAYPLPSYTVI